MGPTVFYEHAVTVAYQDSDRDTGGGTTLTYTTRDTGVACSLLVNTGGESDTFGQQQLGIDATLSTTYADFARGDKVTVTAGPGHVGRVFRVTGIGAQPGLDFLGIPTIYTVKLTTWQ